MTAVGFALPAHGQYALCDTTADELQQRLEGELQRIADDFQAQLEEAHKRFSDGLTGELAKIQMEHQAKMDELDARQAALEGNHFDKFIPMMRLNKDRGLAQLETRQTQNKAEPHWRSVYHQETRDTRTSMQEEKARYEKIYSEQIKARRKANCS